MFLFFFFDKSGRAGKMFLINRNYVQIYFTPAYFYIIQIEANVSNLKKNIIMSI